MKNIYKEVFEISTKDILKKKIISLS